MNTKIDSLHLRNKFKQSVKFEDCGTNRTKVIEQTPIANHCDLGLLIEKQKGSSAL